MKNLLLLLALGLCLAQPATLLANDDDHDDHDDHENESASSIIELEPEAQRAAGVLVERVRLRRLSQTFRVPGEVTINAYQSARVTPRITAQVVARHVRLGDHVEVGQRLMTLSSVEMAAAQGELVVAQREWQRVKGLGSEIVSERRYTEAQVAQQQALARVLAYGMTTAEADALMESGDASRSTGAFDLLAPSTGTILLDDFIVGELIEPGRILIEISDESVVWVEAQAVPKNLPFIDAGDAVRISLDGDTWINGNVIQRHHRLDETTRTQGLRIEVDNREHSLHRGQFVEVEITTGASAPVLAVPSVAITLLDGQSTVFKLEDDHEFHPAPIQPGVTTGEWTTVRGGLTEDESIAVAGVFHLKSLLLKSSLGDGHAH